MAKRKQSTFERLRSGRKLNRKQRKEVQQRLNASDPRLELCIGMRPALIWATRAIRWPYPPGETRNRCGNLGLGRRPWKR
jgi:hypothetical protein